MHHSLNIRLSFEKEESFFFPTCQNIENEAFKSENKSTLSSQKLVNDTLSEMN